VKISCYVPGCEAAAPHELLGLRVCTPHYIEALEHSAHIVPKTYLKRLSEELDHARRRLARIREGVDRREREKKTRVTPPAEAS